MEEMTLHRACRSLRRELCAWQRGALGLLVLSCDHCRLTLRDGRMYLARLDADRSLGLDEIEGVC